MKDYPVVGAISAPIEENDDPEITCAICRTYKPRYCFTLKGNGCVTTSGLCKVCAKPYLREDPGG